MAVDFNSILEEEIKQNNKPRTDIDFQNIMEEEAKPSQYNNINTGNIGTTNESIPDINSKKEAMQFAATMGFADTYRGIKQIFSLSEEQMKRDQAKLNQIFANKEYGRAAFGAYMGGVVADPFGWVIPVAKAKSVSSLVKQGVAFGTGFGAVGYTDESQFDKDTEFWEQKLYQAGLGAVGGGVITGTIGIAGRKALGFDEGVDLAKVTDDVEANRIKKERRNKINLANQDEDQLTLLDSLREKYTRPLWDKMTKNPLAYSLGGAGAYTGLNYLEEGSNAEDYLLNTGLTVMGFFAGKKFGSYLQTKDSIQAALYDLNPNVHMRPEIHTAWKQMKGVMQGHSGALANLHSDLSKLSDDENKLAYQLFTGDIDEGILRKEGAVLNLSSEQIDNIVSLGDKKIEVMKKIGEDMRDAGILSDDVFRTNMDTYMKTTYELLEKAKRGDKEAKAKLNKFQENMSKITGDSVRERGTILDTNLTKTQMQKKVLDYRQERKADFKLRKDYEKKYPDANEEGLPPSFDKKKSGKIINRVEDKADPNYVKGADELDQPSNYGVIVKYDKETDTYDIVGQLTKKQKAELGEIENAALSISRLSQDLTTTLGIGRFYSAIYDEGIAKGFVFDETRLLNNKLKEDGLSLSSRLGSDGKAQYTDAAVSQTELEIFNLRQLLSRTLSKEDRKPLLDEFERLKKQLTEQKADANKRANKIKKEVTAAFNSNDAADKLGLRRVGNDKFTSIVDETRDIPKYGKLNNTLMSKDAFRDIELLSRVREDTYRKGLFNKYFKLQRFWKKTKTVYNPAVHLNNFLSNFSLLFMSNGKFSDLAASLKEFKQILRYERGEITKDDLPQDLRELYDEGGLSADLISAEMKQEGRLLSRYDDYVNTFKLNKVEKDGDFMNAALDSAKLQLEKGERIYGKADRWASDWYQLEDKVFRYALYKSRRKQINPKTGKLYTKEEAAADAIRYFVDYDITSRSVNALRNSLVPFLSYSYRIIPILLETAVVRPEKFAVLAAMGYVANDLATDVAGSDKDKQAIERRLMQKYRSKDMFENPIISMPYSNIRLPYDGNNGGAKYFDISRKLPGSNVFELGGDIPSAIPFLPSVSQPGGPVVDAYNVFIEGRDSFTGQKFKEMGLSAGEVFRNRALKYAKQFVPNLPFSAIPGLEGTDINPASRKINQSLSNYRTLSDPLSPTEALMSTLGFTVNTADIGRLATLKSKEIQTLTKQYTSEIRDLEKQRLKNNIDIDEFREKYKILQERFKKEMDGLAE